MWKFSDVIKNALINSEHDVGLCVKRHLYAVYKEPINLYRSFVDVYSPTTDEYILFEMEMGYAYPSVDLLDELRRKVEKVDPNDKITVVK